MKTYWLFMAMFFFIIGQLGMAAAFLFLWFVTDRDSEAEQK